MLFVRVCERCVNLLLSEYVILNIPKKKFLVADNRISQDMIETRFEVSSKTKKTETGITDINRKTVPNSWLERWLQIPGDQLTHIVWYIQKLIRRPNKEEEGNKWSGVPTLKFMKIDAPLFDYYNNWRDFSICEKQYYY